MLSSALRWLAFALALGCAAALRTCELSQRPMHADEANQAVKTGELLENGTYAFDPRDHHGPTLYYCGAIVARLRGERTLAALSENTVRVVPAAFGICCVVVVAGLVKIGMGGASLPFEAILAAAFLALCPAAVYYSRYYIHETLLLGFVLLTIFAIAQWVRSGRAFWAVVAGVAAGCALATKETAIVFFATAGFATWVTAQSDWGAEPPTGATATPNRHTVLMVAAALLTAAAFYSSFGRHFAGIRDALEAPILGARHAAAHSSHDKPWWYYVSLLTWQRNGGLVWHHLLLTVLALIGAIAGWRRPHVRWAAIYAGVLLLAISAVPYKTPWNAIHVLPAFAVLAAAGVIAIARLRTGRIVAGSFAFLGLATLGSQTYRVAFRYSADARNPYAYVHSSPDVTKFRAIVERALAADAEEPIRIISPEYWPLPWYLRGLPRIGYWTTPPANCDGALVIAAADLANDVRRRMRGHYREDFLGLRPGFTMVVFDPHSP